jgi:phage shock protein C
MYCTKCGIQTDEANNFCPACGHETPRAAEARRAGTGAFRAPRRLYRLDYDKKIAGVCAGLAQYFDVDVTLVRLIVAAGIAMSVGVGILAYIVAWILMPVDYGTRAPQPSATPQASV